MIVSKFGIGQQVCYCFYGYLGVVIDIDFEYFFELLVLDEVVNNDMLCLLFWYYVVIEDDEG